MLGLMFAVMASTVSPHSSFQVAVRGDQAGNCTAAFDGVTYALPDDETKMKAALKGLIHRSTMAHLDAGLDTPYKCVGAFVSAAQQVGLRHIGFISEPPAP